MIIDYTKMNGTKNTMIMIDNRDNQIQLTDEQASTICKKLDSDGLILLENRNSDEDCYMNYYNRDGSLGLMCGNGIRCTADFFIQLTQTQKSELTIGTLGGPKKIQVQENHNYTVNMGQPTFEEPIELQNLKLHRTYMPNPHAIAFIDDIDSFDLETIGPKIETDPIFPDRTNFEIVEIISPQKARLRVWERGSGLTLSCGTGATAVFITAKKLGLIESPATIELPGGELQFEETENKEILMTGPAETEHSGQIEI